MNIVVCVKYVPDAQGDRTFDESDNTTDRVSVDGLLSELDEYAVEEALKIVEAGEGEVTVLTVGPEQAADAIKKSLQMGAHKGVHVLDDAIHGSDAVATSLVLAEAVRKIGIPDLVLTGMSSTDGTMGVVPAMLAERLGLPQVTYASELTVEAGTVRIRRDGDAASETIEAALPALVSVTDQINEPRYPSFKGIMAAKKKPVERWASPTSASTRRRSVSVARGRPSPRSRSARRASRARSSPTRAMVAPGSSSSSPPRSFSDRSGATPARKEDPPTWLTFSFWSTT